MRMRRFSISPAPARHLGAMPAAFTGHAPGEARRRGAAMSAAMVIMFACFAIAIMLSLLNCGR
jgi:hypothetical protein